jgi:hypothetical protein
MLKLLHTKERKKYLENLLKEWENYNKIMNKNSSFSSYCKRIITPKKSKNPIIPKREYWKYKN